MACPKCNMQNPEGNRFCNGCGTELGMSVNGGVNTIAEAGEPMTTKTGQAESVTGVDRLKQWKWGLRIVGLVMVGILLVVGLAVNRIRKQAYEAAVEEDTRASSVMPQPIVRYPSATPTATAEQDTDKDGLTDSEEAKYGTNPLVADTDGDGDRDGEEVATGYDPLKDDCVYSVCGVEVKEGVDIEKPTNLLLILDASGSMAGRVSGQPKIEVAKQAIRDYVDRLPAEMNLGLMVYGHKGSNNEQDKQLSCSSPEVLSPLAELDITAIKEAIAGFSPVGWTPIAGSLTKAKNEVFAGKETENNRIMLVSDGIETCDGDPCAVAKELKESGIETVVDVIGFDVDAAARNQLECIAKVTGGTYYHTTTAEEFNRVFADSAARWKAILELTFCRFREVNKWTSCVFKKGQAISSYRFQHALQ